MYLLKNVQHIGEIIIGINHSLNEASNLCKEAETEINKNRITKRFDELFDSATNTISETIRDSSYFSVGFPIDVSQQLDIFLSK